MLSEQEKKEMALVFELQAVQDNIIWMVEGIGETIDGMNVVDAIIEGKKVYSIPKLK